MLQETDYMKMYFPFHETDKKSINPDVLFYAGRAAGCRRERERMEIGYSCSHWCSHIFQLACVWQPLRKMAEGYQAGDSTVKKNNTVGYKLFSETHKRFVVVRKHFTAACAVGFPIFFPTTGFLSPAMMKLSVAHIIFLALASQLVVLEPYFSRV